MNAESAEICLNPQMAEGLETISYGIRTDWSNHSSKLDPIILASFNNDVAVQYSDRTLYNTLHSDYAKKKTENEHRERNWYMEFNSDCRRNSKLSELPFRRFFRVAEVDLAILGAAVGRVGGVAGVTTFLDGSLPLQVLQSSLPDVLRPKLVWL